MAHVLVSMNNSLGNTFRLLLRKLSAVNEPKSTPSSCGVTRQAKH
jgi:hypothetical protein